MKILNKEQIIDDLINNENRSIEDLAKYMILNSGDNVYFTDKDNNCYLFCDNNWGKINDFKEDINDFVTVPRYLANEELADKVKSYFLRVSDVTNSDQLLFEIREYKNGTKKSLESYYKIFQE